MTTKNWTLAATLGIAFILAGCGKKAGGDHSGHSHDAEQPKATAHEEHAQEGATFAEGKGLSIPKETAAFIGLRVADIEENQVNGSFKFTATVYRTSSGAQLASTTKVSARVSWASGFVHSAQGTKLTKGQKVTALFGDARMAANVAEINTPFGTNANQIELLVAIEDESRKLNVGDSLSILVESSEEHSSVTIPKTALLRTAEGTFAYTVSGEHYVRTPIKIGVAAGDKIEVTDGLYTGDQVVVAPVMSLWMAELQAIRGGKACADGH